MGGGGDGDGVISLVAFILVCLGLTCSKFLTSEVIFDLD